MLVADSVILVPNLDDRDFPILVGQRNQLAASVFLWSSALIGIDMRVVAA
jgi:hypothetical protein